ncbi:hypothetical protein SLI_3863 [Streptomyces lividans 1326]|uniref:Uncharacterized protein n=1 Tax=Streptomyces lividans 1326 TaxID=1200984 RepID=A0A7U9DVU9_STRLI|nr:hypothetical protein SLI_3863 [Streptomyces lividans 1326]
MRTRTPEPRAGTLPTAQWVAKGRVPSLFRPEEGVDQV